MLSYNGSVLKVNGGWLDYVPPPDPGTTLPPGTLRVQYLNKVVASSGRPKGRSFYTYQAVDLVNQIYDLTLTGTPTTGWLNDEFEFSSNVNRYGYILDANLADVTSVTFWFDSSGESECRNVTFHNAVDITSLSGAFRYCCKITADSWVRCDNLVQNIYIGNLINLTSAAYMCDMTDSSVGTTVNPYLQTVTLQGTTEKLTSTYRMFNACASLTQVPLFNTDGVTDVRNMFNYCINMWPSHVLAWYQQLSSQRVPPAQHSDCFTNAGISQSGGAAVLAQIPASWGGTGEG
jgi:hypothetical protein